jgi:hypothetical protein
MRKNVEELDLNDDYVVIGGQERTCSLVCGTRRQHEMMLSKNFVGV